MSHIISFLCFYRKMFCSSDWIKSYPSKNKAIPTLQCEGFSSVFVFLISCYLHSEWPYKETVGRSVFLLWKDKVLLERLTKERGRKEAADKVKLFRNVRNAERDSLESQLAPLFPSASIFSTDCVDAIHRRGCLLTSAISLTQTGVLTSLTVW